MNCMCGVIDLLHLIDVPVVFFAESLKIVVHCPGTKSPNKTAKMRRAHVVVLSILVVLGGGG